MRLTPIAVLAVLVVGAIAFLRAPASPADAPLPGGPPSPEPSGRPSPPPTMTPSAAAADVEGQLLYLEHVREGRGTTPTVSGFVVVPADGTSDVERREAGGYTGASLIAISPDATRVAYWRSRSTAPLMPPFELVLWDVTGADGQVIYRTDTMRPADLLWSARGNELAFGLYEGSDPLPFVFAERRPARLFVIEAKAGAEPRDVGPAPHRLLYYDGEIASGFRHGPSDPPSPPAETAYEVIDVGTGLVRSSEPAEFFTATAVSPTGLMAGWIRPFEEPGRSIRVWEAVNYGAELARIDVVGVEEPLFRPGSSELVFAVNGRELMAIEIDTKSVRTIHASVEPVRPVAFDPSGTYLLANTGGHRHAVLRAGLTYERLVEVGMVASSTSPLAWIPEGRVSGPPSPRAVARELPSADAEEAVGERARATVEALRARDVTALAAMVHPRRGILFSPYPHISLQNDQRLRAEELESAFADPAQRIWGQYDGRGGDIALSLEEYWERFVYDRDFAAAPEVAFNATIGSGSQGDNSLDVYPDAILVEYHFPSSPNTLDWRSLRLFFEELEGQWYLVGVVHAEWTT